MGELAEHESRFDDILPNWHCAKGSLGSELLVLRDGSPKVLRAMVDELRGRFRQCRYDLAAGIAVFMAPSRPIGLRPLPRTRTTTNLTTITCPSDDPRRTKRHPVLRMRDQSRIEIARRARLGV